MIKVVIADDHQVMLDGLRAILDKDSKIEIVGTALNGREAVRLLETKHVHIVVTDISMPVMDGIDLCKHVKEKYPHIKVLALTMYEEKAFVMGLLEAGAHGYILKKNGQAELLKAIAEVHKGNEYYPHEIMQIIIKERAKPKPEVITFTKRELEVLCLIVDGKTTTEIAEILFIAIPTVNAHRRNMLQKIDGRNAVDLTRYALKNNIC